MSEEDDQEGRGDYVFRVREQTRQHLRDLLSENEKLRRANAALDSERNRLVAEKMMLQEKLLGLREEYDRFQREQADLRRRLAETEEENRQFSLQSLEIELQNNNLANLYVASYQLHSTLDHDEVMAAIKEIVINLIGCEEFGVYEMDDDGRTLRLAGSFGLDPVTYATVPVGSGLIGRAAATGVRYLLGSPAGTPTPREVHLTACIPLKLGEKVLGVLAVFRLLAHKRGLEAVDRELFDLLATHAATALYVSRLHREKVEASRPA
jgi:nitrate/nitrite-specific signal transduction histidine kinase